MRDTSHMDRTAIYTHTPKYSLCNAFLQTCVMHLTLVPHLHQLSMRVRSSTRCSQLDSHRERRAFVLVRAACMRRLTCFRHALLLSTVHRHCIRRIYIPSHECANAHIKHWAAVAWMPCGRVLERYPHPFFPCSLRPAPLLSPNCSVSCVVEELTRPLITIRSLR